LIALIGILFNSNPQKKYWNEANKQFIRTSLKEKVDSLRPNYTETQKEQVINCIIEKAESKYPNGFPRDSGLLIGEQLGSECGSIVLSSQ